MKRLGLLLMLLVLTLVAAQCGGQTPTATAPTAAAPTQAAKAAAPTEAPKAAAPTVAPAVAKPTEAAKAAPAAGQVVKMAFVPSTDSAKVLASGEKIGQLLEKETGLKFQVSVPTSYAAVLEAMNAGQIDVAWLAPLSYVVGNNKYGVELILTTTRNGSKVYPFEFVIRSDSTIKDLNDFKGKKIAFADELSASGNLYPRAYLLQNGIDPDKDMQPIYSGAHDKSVIALLNGQVDVAAIFGEYKGTPDARNNVKSTVPDVYEKTKVFLNSADKNFLIPNDTVSVRKGLDAALKKKIQDGLIAVSKTEDGIKELKALYNIDGLVVGDPADYAPIQKAADAAKIDIGKAIQPPPTRPPATAAPAGGTPKP